MNNILIIIIAMYSLSYCEETIYYTAKFKNINAGSATLKTKNNLYDEFIEINFSLKTRKMIDVFYKLRDDIQAFINPEDFSLIKIKKKSEQGKYSKVDEATFDYEKNYLNHNDKSEIKFWIDEKPPHLPIIIETKSKNGDIILKYNSHKINNEQ